ncbi:MAG: glycosyltransferase family 2 protein [Saprospiraceae bacterium]
MIIDVIIPALNEEKSIGFVIKAIPKGFVRNIYVCDNNSTDATTVRALEAGAQVLVAGKKGYGSACQAGIQKIIANGTANYPDILVFIDGDYSDYPEEMILLVDKMQTEGLDLVIGSRISGNLEKGALTIVQRFGNKLATYLIRIFFKYHFTDLGPFRAIRFQKLLELKMEDPNYGWTVEMQVKAAKHKFRVGEVPVSYRKRIGISKISGTFKGVIGAGSKILLIIFKSFVKG